MWRRKNKHRLLIKNYFQLFGVLSVQDIDILLQVYKIMKYVLKSRYTQIGDCKKDKKTVKEDQSSI